MTQTSARSGPPSCHPTKMDVEPYFEVCASQPLQYTSRVVHILIPRLSHPSVLLQATNAGVRRPQNKARLYIL